MKKSDFKKYSKGVQRRLPWPGRCSGSGGGFHYHRQPEGGRGSSFCGDRRRTGGRPQIYPDVMAKGAPLASVSERELEGAEFPYIQVESSLQAVKDIAEFYLEQLQIPVVGITGSVGKTSTKEVIASVLKEKYRTLKTQGILIMSWDCR